MAKKKRYRGHFCKVCWGILPNEKFSGKGHAAHICNKCAKKVIAAFRKGPFI
ncbi:MAG: zinc finger domain-containing protein [Methanosarcinales archaeon]